MRDLLFFVHLFKPYKFWLCSGLLLAMLTALAGIALLTVSGWFITSSALAGLAASSEGVAISFNFILPAAQIRALAIIRTLGRYGERIVSHEATFRVLTEIRSWFFAKLIPLAPGRLTMQRNSDLLHNMTQDINALDGLYLRIGSPIVVALLCGLLIAIFVSFYSLKLGLYMFISMILLGAILPTLFIRWGYQSAKKIGQFTAEFKTKQIEILQGLADLIVFGAFNRFKIRLLNTSEQLLKVQTENNRIIVLSSVSTAFISQLGLLISIILTSILFQQQQILGAIMLMLCFAVLGVFELINSLSQPLQTLVKTKDAAKRVRRVTELTPTIVEPETSHALSLNNDISINNLYFRYSDKSNWILNNVSLSIAQGCKIGIIGENGVGKSTMLQLIMRFYDPDQGSIKYAGVNYQQIRSDELLQKFAVLSQRTQLFASTIKQNLLIARPSASDSELNQALDHAGLTKFIKTLTLGIDTWIGENGVKISTGEARRIALARLYLKDATILLLDEPTEGLDKDTETYVLQKLQQLSQEKTLILVTHRQIGLDLVDQIYKLSVSGKLNLVTSD